MSSEELNGNLEELMRLGKFAEVELFCNEALKAGSKMTNSTYRILMEAAVCLGRCVCPLLPASDLSTLACMNVQIGAKNYARTLSLFDEVREKQHTTTSAMYVAALTACHATSTFSLPLFPPPIRLTDLGRNRLFAENEAKATLIWTSMRVSQIERKPVHYSMVSER